MSRFARQQRGEVRLLVGAADGAECLLAHRDPQAKGVQIGGVTYPDELLRYLGEDVYLLASQVKMPADGDVSHPGSYRLVRPVTQLSWMADWADYDKGRRRLNAAAVFDRGAGVGVLLSNLSKALMVVALLIVLWSTWGLKGASTATADRLQVQNGLLSKLVAPPSAVSSAVVQNVPATATIGAPAADRRTPTPRPK